MQEDTHSHSHRSSSVSVDHDYHSHHSASSSSATSHFTSFNNNNNISSSFSIPTTSNVAVSLDLPATTASNISYDDIAEAATDKKRGVTNTSFEEIQQQEQQQKKSTSNSSFISMLGLSSTNSTLSQFGNNISTALHNQRRHYFIHSQRRIEEVEIVRERIEKEFGCVLDPNNKFLRYWDLIVLILLWTQLFYVPFTLGVTGGLLFVSTRPGQSWLAIGIICSLILTVDTILNFFRAFYDSKNKLVCLHSMIIKNYLYGWFLIDLLACIPTSIIQYFSLPVEGDAMAQVNGTYYGNSENSSDSGGGSVFDIGDPFHFKYSAVRFLDIFVLFRYPRVFRSANSAWRFSDYNIGISYVGQEALKYIFLFLWFVHLTACLWSLMYIKDTKRYTWLHKWYDSQEHVDMEPFGNSVRNIRDRYTASLYWAMYTFVSVGYGDISPSNTEEFYVATFVIFLDSIIWAYITASAISLTMIYQRERNKFLLRIDAANEIIHVINDVNGDHRLDPTLGLEIRSFMHEQHKKTKLLRAIELSKKMIATSMSPHLWKRLMLELSHSIFNSVEMLKFISEESKYRIMCSIKHQTFAPGEYFTVHGKGKKREHEKESYPNRGIYILQAGICVGARATYSNESFQAMVQTLNETFLSPTHKLIPKTQTSDADRLAYLRKIRSSFSVYNAGKVIGSTDIFLEDESPALRPINLGALTFVDFAVIPRDVIMKELEHDPKLQHIFHRRRRYNVLQWVSTGITKHQMVKLNE